MPDTGRRTDHEAARIRRAELVEQGRELGLEADEIAGLELAELERLLPLVADVVAHDRRAAVVLDPAGELVRALAAAQGAFPAIPKTKTAKVKMNTGGEYTYSYADLADVLAAVRPVLAAEGLAITQRTQRLESGMTLHTELRHTAGGVLATEVELAQSPANAQAFGGALTYLRRYELTTLLGIHADEDTDGQHVEPPAAQTTRAEPPPAWARDATKARLTKLGEALEPIIGLDAARELVAAVKSNLGVFPDVLVQFAGAIRARHNRDVAGGPEPGGDPPAAEPDDQADAALAAAAAAAAEAGDPTGLEAEEPPPDAGLPIDGSAEDVRPPAGSVPMPPLPDNALERVEALRAAGCTCDKPISTHDDDHDGACPIAGHGIPF